ncbi:hypothetical protein F2Q70_00000117 [Brassica cretica]|uniref:RRM domain-containing protein n=1 Tax=Brassica cretica TaxID=69181 RepID=A0A8S9IMC8_BRACR|nr:hypothetical protein F2Q70_00000117 [Brassica cretica]
MSSRSSRTIYVGNLPGDIREREVEDLFSKYGPVVQIDLKIPPRPPGYAFVEFEDPRDADDAIHGRDGYDFDGHCLRVELAHGGRRSSNDARGSYGGGSRGGGGGRDGGDRGRGPSRRSEYRVVVSGLPSSASWQDLKDHMRKGGEVCFSQVFRDGRGTTGIVDYTSYEDMKYAIKKLDDTEFRNAFSRGYVRISFKVKIPSASCSEGSKQEPYQGRERKEPWRKLVASPSYQKTLSSTSSSSSKTILETGLASHASAPNSPRSYGTSAVKLCATLQSPPSSPNSSLLPPPLHPPPLCLLPAAGLLSTNSPSAVPVSTTPESSSKTPISV